MLTLMTPRGGNLHVLLALAVGREVQTIALSVHHLPLMKHKEFPSYPWRELA